MDIDVSVCIDILCVACEAEGGGGGHWEGGDEEEKKVEMCWWSGRKLQAGWRRITLVI